MSSAPDDTAHLSLDEDDVDARLAGVNSVRRQQELERGRLGGMFAASMVEKIAIKEWERRADERTRRHEERTASMRKRVAIAAAADRKASEEHRRKALEQAMQRQQAAEQAAQSSWMKIEERNQALMTQRDAEARKRQAGTEARRAASMTKLKMRREAEEHRLSEVKKRSELLEDHRARLCSKQNAVKENTKEYEYIAKREKEVVRDMYYEYCRTGHLAKPWGLIDLSGDALPALLTIATDKSKGHISRSDYIPTLPENNEALLMALPVRGPKVRSLSSLD